MDHSKIWISTYLKNKKIILKIIQFDLQVPFYMDITLKQFESTI